MACVHFEGIQRGATTVAPRIRSRYRKAVYCKALPNYKVSTAEWYTNREKYTSVSDVGYVEQSIVGADVHRFELEELALDGSVTPEEYFLPSSYLPHERGESEPRPPRRRSTPPRRRRPPSQDNGAGKRPSTSPFRRAPSVLRREHVEPSPRAKQASSSDATPYYSGPATKSMDRSTQYYSSNQSSTPLTREHSEPSPRARWAASDASTATTSPANPPSSASGASAQDIPIAALMEHNAKYFRNTPPPTPGATRVSSPPQSRNNAPSWRGFGLGSSSSTPASSAPASTGTDAVDRDVTEASLAGLKPEELMRIAAALVAQRGRMNATALPARAWLGAPYHGLGHAAAALLPLWAPLRGGLQARFHTLGLVLRCMAAGQELWQLPTTRGVSVRGLAGRRGAGIAGCPHGDMLCAPHSMLASMSRNVHAAASCRNVSAHAIAAARVSSLGDPEDTESGTSPFWAGSTATGTDSLPAGLTALGTQSVDGATKGCTMIQLKVFHDGLKLGMGMDGERDMDIQPGDLFVNRYQIVELLGSATSSRVFVALDTATDTHVCLKVIKNDKDYFDQSLNEIKLLQYCNLHDPEGRVGILRMHDYFYYHEHLVIVTELLRENLYEWQHYVTHTPEEPHYFTLQNIQKIAQQVLAATAFMHDLGLIHNDLKPENVAIDDYTHVTVKLIDLGATRHVSDNLSSYVQSRSYRAPEVILGLDYGPKIDVWSIGAILAELSSGQVLFQNNSAASLLARLESILGPVPMSMIVKGKHSRTLYTRSRKLFVYASKDDEPPSYLVLQPKETTLADQLPDADEGFLGFIKYLLTVDPEKRPTAREALSHPWLQKQYPDSPLR